MSQIEVSVLTQHEFRPIAHDTDQPWALIADDLKNVWTCLGLYDPVLKKVRTTHTERREENRMNGKGRAVTASAMEWLLIRHHACALPVVC